MLLGVCFGLGIHVLVSCGVTNRPLMHAAEGIYKQVEITNVFVI